MSCHQKFPTFQTKPLSVFSRKLEQCKTRALVICALYYWGKALKIIESQKNERWECNGYLLTLSGCQAVNDFLIYHCGEPVKITKGEKYGLTWNSDGMSVQKFPAFVYLS